MQPHPPGSRQQPLYYRLSQPNPAKALPSARTFSVHVGWGENIQLRGDRVQEKFVDLKAKTLVARAQIRAHQDSFQMPAASVIAKVSAEVSLRGFTERPGSQNVPPSRTARPASAPVGSPRQPAAPGGASPRAKLLVSPRHPEVPMSADPAREARHRAAQLSLKKSEALRERQGAERAERLEAARERARQERNRHVEQAKASLDLWAQRKRQGHLRIATEKREYEEWATEQLRKTETRLEEWREERRQEVREHAEETGAHREYIDNRFEQIKQERLGRMLRAEEEAAARARALAEEKRQYLEQRRMEADEAARRNLEGRMKLAEEVRGDGVCGGSGGKAQGAWPQE